MNRQQRQIFAFIAVLFTLYIALQLWYLNDSNSQNESLLNTLKKLEERISEDGEKIELFRRRLNTSFRDKFGQRNLLPLWIDPIPVLVFVCNRPAAVKYHVEKLIRIRKSKAVFPIVVSHGCKNARVTDVVESFKPHVQYIKHPETDIKVPRNHQRYAMYYKIANHYRNGLRHVFDTLNHSSVIMTEDDLDVSEDFFEYFAATRPILEADKSVYCVSAWNDNGKSDLIDIKASDLLYRSDFFPGLGWMMTRELWREIEPEWPDGFWDDWIREPEQRKNRSCIRPEVSRTSMTLYGKSGASEGLFFNRHLRKIVLNERPVTFTNMDLSYLLKSHYDVAFIARVYLLPAISVEAFIKQFVLRKSDAVVKRDVNDSTPPSFRVEYTTMDKYLEIARQLRVMPDAKAGVPRTAYLGIVTCFISNVRLYIAPSNDSHWQTYSRYWEAKISPIIDY